MLDIMPCRETISYRVAVPELAGQGVLVQVMIFFYSSSIDSYQHGYCIGTIIRPAHSQKYRGDSLYNVALVDDKALEGRYTGVSIGRGENRRRGYIPTAAHNLFSASGKTRDRGE